MLYSVAKFIPSTVWVGIRIRARARTLMLPPVRLQVQYERWRASEEGEAASAQRKALPIHQMEEALKVRAKRACFFGIL